jgi:hypothetical protein
LKQTKGNLQVPEIDRIKLKELKMNYPAAELRSIKMDFILLIPMQSIEEFF